MYRLDNQLQKISAASASLRETHYFEHSPKVGIPNLLPPILAIFLPSLGSTTRNPIAGLILDIIYSRNGD
jgi:hypothetical protein